MPNKSSRNVAAAQTSFENVGGWGGKRRGAGRPNRSLRVNHMARPRVSLKQPLHLTLKLADQRWNLRCKPMASLFKRSAARGKMFGLHIIHFSLLKDHLHIIVEVQNNDALTRGMRSFAASLAKQIRKLVGGSGAVFRGRFHLNVIKNPTQMRHTLAYVLQNFAKHTGLIEHLDCYSSASYFTGWRKLFGKKASPMLFERVRKPPPIPEFLSPPRSWLACEGWTKARIA